MPQSVGTPNGSGRIQQNAVFQNAVSVLEKLDPFSKQRLISPNFVVLRGGCVVFQQAGLVPRAEMRRWLEAA
jgi:hypothetical protein